MEKIQYPKQMTIRYSEEQEKEIEKLKLRLDENTATKAFLKTPKIIEAQARKIASLTQNIAIQSERIEKLEGILRSWSDFNNKLEEMARKIR